MNFTAIGQIAALSNPALLSDYSYNLLIPPDIFLLFTVPVWFQMTVSLFKCHKGGLVHECQDW
jgi:hypothetical protein